MCFIMGNFKVSLFPFSSCTTEGAMSADQQSKEPGENDGNNVSSKITRSACNSVADGVTVTGNFINTFLKRSLV